MASGNHAPSATVVFEDPPPSSTGRYDWSAIAARLKAQPNEWGRVFESDVHSLVVSIRQAKSSHPLSPQNGFETKTRNNHYGPDGRRMCALYVRYVAKKK